MAASSSQLPFEQRQPSSLRAILVPSSLDGYQAKTRSLPRWLDYVLFGPPAVRDSSPGSMAFIFGRTEHDAAWNPSPKGPVTRAFHAMFLSLAYLLFLIVPFHFIYSLGVKPYNQQ